MVGTSRTYTEGISGPIAPLEPVVVEAVDGPGKGARSVLKIGTLSIGTDPGNDLVLADRSVSRQHATAEILPGALRVKDLGSRNGTFYLNARIDQARVPVGGSIRVGRTVLRFSPVQQDIAPSTRDELCGLIGRSQSMRRLFAILEKVGPTDGTVLIRGESGVGKEAVAQCLHALSTRAQGPFRVFECAAANANLIESELFGHVRGAFTGADRARVGAVEAAAGGTLVLDEVGALPLELQPKLLRLLESHEFRRVGDGTVLPASVRVLATTQRDLAADSRSGAFRSDLYFRVAVSEVEVPPLRLRLEDIPLLASHFARLLTGSEVPLSPATLAALQCDSWPGNVRELRNAVERALTLGTSLRSQEHPDETPRGASFMELRDKTLHEFERDYLTTLLERHHGNVSAAARDAKLSRSQFYRLLARHDIAAKE
jgi:DNA-binding NtrC family response regulator